MHALGKKNIKLTIWDPTLGNRKKEQTKSKAGEKHFFLICRAEINKIEYRNINRENQLNQKLVLWKKIHYSEKI